MAVEYTVSAVTASSFQDPNRPENVIDGIDNTRWANQGIDSWIQLDLGEEKTPIRSVGIKWYKGNERRYNFVIRISTDATNFQDVITNGRSSGATLDLERYDFSADATARYVRVIVNGNSVNNWASIHTSKIFSEASTNGGGDGGGNIARNGVLQIYENNPRIALWTMGFDNWRDFVSRWGTVSGTDRDTITSATTNQTRMSVKCKPDAGDGITDLGQAMEQGFLDSPKDYKNVEVTGYAQITTRASNGKDQDLTYYGPTGRHTGDMCDEEEDPECKDLRGCMGSCYKGSIHYVDGKARIAKESWHVNYDHKPWVGANAQIPSGKRLGMKWVNFLFTKQNGRQIRRLEVWIDHGGIKADGNPTNSWKLVRLEEDNGTNMGSRMKLCKCPTDKQLITWAAPSVTYRADNTKWKLSYATVQEINPPTTLHDLGKVITV